MLENEIASLRLQLKDSQASNSELSSQVASLSMQREIGLNSHQKLHELDSEC